MYDCLTNLVNAHFAFAVTSPVLFAVAVAVAVAVCVFQQRELAERLVCFAKLLASGPLLSLRFALGPFPEICSSTSARSFVGRHVSPDFFVQWGIVFEPAD